MIGHGEIIKREIKNLTKKGDKMGKTGKWAFVSYLNDNDSKREGKFLVTDYNAAFVEFVSDNNSVLVIPMNRVLKIKFRENENGN